MNLNPYVTKATAPPKAPQIQQTWPHQEQRCAWKSCFFYADYAWRGVFFATRDSSGYRDWLQSNAEKRSAVKDKLFPAFISFAARRRAAQRGAACSVAPAMTNSRLQFIFL